MKQKKLIRYIINKTRENPFIQGGIFYTISNFIVVFLNYLFNIFAARALGPSDFGEISTFFSYLIILTTPIGILSSYFLVKIGSKKKPEAYISSVLNLINNFIKQKWLFILVPILIILPFLPSITNLSPVTTYFLIPTVLLLYYAAAYESSLQGLHLFFLISIFSIIFTLTKLIGAVLIVTISQGLSIIMLFIFLAFVIKFLLGYITLRKKLIKTKVESISFSFKKLFKDNQLTLTFISSISFAFIANFDIIFVKKFFSGEDAGIFASWLLFTKVVTVILGPLISLSFVFFSSKKHEVQHQLFFIGTWILLGLSGFVSLVVYGFYGRLFIDLFLGEKFYPVFPYIEWASLAGTAYMMLFFMNNYYLAKGSKKIYILASAIPFYIGSLFMFGNNIGNVMLINILFAFGVIGIYLLLFFKSRFASLWE